MDDEVTSADRPTTRDRSALDHLVPSHLRVARRSWAFLLVAALTVFAIVEAARTLARMHDEVVPGVYYSLKMRVMSPLPEAARAAGIDVQDRIASVDGRTFDDPWALSAYLRTVGLDRTVHLVLASQARTTTADLATFAPSWPTAWLQFVVGAIYALVGIAVFWFHPGRRESWPFLFGCVAWGIALLTGLGEPRTTSTALQGRLSLVAYAAAGPMLVYLFAVFPRPLGIVIRRPRLLTGLALAVIGLGGLAALHPTQLVSGLAVAATAVLNACSLIGAVTIVVWRLRRAGPAEDTTRLRALIVAAVLAFPVAAVLTLARVLGYTPATHTTRWLGTGLAVLFPLLVGNAILRRDLLEIDRAVARAAGASAIVGLAAIAAIGIAVAVPTLFAPAAVVGSRSAMAIVVLGGVALLWPVKRRLQDRLVARFGRPDVDERMATARAALGELAETPDAALFGRFERRLEEVVDLDDVALLLPEGSAWRRPATGERVAPTSFGRVLELRLCDELVGGLGLGRPAARAAPRAIQIAGALGPEISRALRSGRSGDRIGDYRIDRFVAAGGMGNVYAGVRVGAGGFVKEVAIKQLLPELAVEPAVVDRFLKEARLVARLKHPGIVQTLELGETERGYYIVMEYVDGIDAATLMRRLKRRRQRIALPVAAQAVTSVCLALEHVHRACDDSGAPLHLIHHDVSPHNILIDGDGNPKLADFGVARMRQDTPSRGQLVGKIAYMAPEQIAGHSYDHRIDVFAAGIVLYELVTCQHPFARGTEEATLRAIEHGRFLPPETLREDCPDELVQVIARALAPVARRFASAAELAEALQRVYPLDSRHASQLGQLVRSVRSDDPKASTSMPAATLSLPTVRG